VTADQGIDANSAFELLREHSNHNGDKLGDIARAIAEGHQLVAPGCVHG